MILMVWLLLCIWVLQASVYKVDFEAERKSREELNDERLKLQEKLITMEEELQAVKIAKQMAEMQFRDRYAAGRRSGGLAEEAHVFQQQLIAQEQSATQAATATAAAAAPTATAAPVETQPANRATTEVCLTSSVHVSVSESVCPCSN